MIRRGKGDRVLPYPAQNPEVSAAVPAGVWPADCHDTKRHGTGEILPRAFLDTALFSVRAVRAAAAGEGERAGIRVIHPVFHNFPQFSTVNCGEVGQLLYFLRYFVNSYPREGWKNHAGFQQIWWKPAWSVDFSTVFCAGCLLAGRVQSW